MNILFLDQFSDPGGAQISLMHAIEGVLSRGWKAHVMVPGDGELVNWCHRNGVAVDSLGLSSMTNGRKTVGDSFRLFRNLPAITAAIRDVCARRSIDLIYVNGPRVLPAVTSLGAPQPPVLFHSHNYVGQYAARWLLARALRQTGATVIAASHFTARQFPPEIRRRVRVIYNGASDYGGAERFFDRKKPRIAMLGRIAPEKGHPDFVQAARQMDAGSAAFAIYGDDQNSGNPYASKIRQEAADAGIELHPWSHEIHEIFREIDILAVPSFAHEASPRVIVEAFSAGVPVVAYPSGGIPEIVEHARTGWITESRSPASLTASLQTLIADNPLRLRLAAAARCEWRERFTQSAFQNAICDAISSAARRSDPDADDAPDSECRHDRSQPAMTGRP